MAAMMRTSTCNLFGASNTSNRPLLNGAQQFHLHSGTHLADLVEKYRPLVSNFEQTLLVGDGARKSSLHVAEQFTLQESLRKRAAVDADECIVSPRAVQVNGLRDKFLSCSAFSGNQNRAVGSADNLDHLEQFLHRSALADQVAHTVDFLELATQVGVLLAQSAIFESVTDNDLEFFEIVLGLEDVVERAHLQRLNRGVRAGKRRQKNELPVEVVGSHVAQEIDARHVRHSDIRDDQVKLRRLDQIQRFRHALSCLDLESFFPQENFEQFSY